MTERGRAASGIDTSTPNVARIYDYLLGGKDDFAADRAAAHVRSVPEIRRFFDGFELVDPGVVWMNEWRPDPGILPSGQATSLRAGVGRKP